MAIVFYVLVIILLLAIRKGKIISNIALFYLLILFCFNTGIADRDAYIMDMERASISIVPYFEPFWNWILVTFDNHHIDIQYLYIIVGAIYLPSLFYVLKKLSNNDNGLIACYMIGLFFMDVVQLRFSFSLVFILWAVYSLLFVHGKRGVILFVGLVIVAFLVHSSNILFLLLLLVKFERRKVSIVSSILFLIFLLSYQFILSYFGDFLDMTTKVQNVMEGDRTSAHSVLTSTMSCALILVMVLYTNIKLNNKRLIDTSLWELALKLAIVSLVCIPLINFSPDIRRHVYVFFILVAAFVFRISQSCRSQQLVRALPLLIAFLYFMLTVFTGNRETVFNPMFEHNLFFDYF